MKKKDKAVLTRCLKGTPLLNAGKSYAAYVASLLTKKPVVWGMPPIVMIEPTNICNLKCPLCPSGNGTLLRKKGYMDLSLYRKVIDEISKTVLAILYWNQGEPFLHPEILEMFSYAKKKGIYIRTSTNANVMPDPELLVESGLDSIIISLDGATQYTYNKYRVNGNFSDVIANTEALVAAKKEKKSTAPIIEWQFLVMKHNEHEVETIKTLAKKVGVDDLIFKTVQIFEESDIDEFLPSDPKFRRYNIGSDGFELKKKILNRCRRIFTQPVVNWDGELAICCYDKDNVCSVGNLKENTFTDLWHSARMNQWRKVILTNRKSIEICRNCGEGVKLSIKKNI